MSIVINEELSKILADPETIKVLASVDMKGNPHVVAKGSIGLTKENELVYLELIESSRTNKNLTAAIWFSKKVAITVISKDKRSYQIKGTPRKTLIAGSVFEQFYKSVLERNKENDLAAVYYIEIEEIIDESYQSRLKEEREKHPLYIHLDKLTQES